MFLLLTVIQKSQKIAHYYILFFIVWPYVWYKSMTFTLLVLVRVVWRFFCIWWPKFNSRSSEWIGGCCAFHLSRICSLPLWFAHWHFQMWVVHKGCDWGERLTFCVSASTWQWLRSTDIYKSAELSTPKISHYEKERKCAHYKLYLLQ